MPRSLRTVPGLPIGAYLKILSGQPGCVGAGTYISTYNAEASGSNLHKFEASEFYMAGSRTSYTTQ